MRSIVCVLGLVGCFTNRAEADVSKAWAAAKDHLPASTQFVFTFDVAAISRSPLFSKAFDLLATVERQIGVFRGLGRTACDWDPISVIEGVVIAGNFSTKEGVAFVQLNVDRAKASACLESALVGLGTGKKVRQEGAYTVATKGTGRSEAYFPWIGSNVVVISFDPDRKAKVDAWWNQKGFASSKAGIASIKRDPKAVVTVASGNEAPFDPNVPVSSAFGNWTLAGGKLSGVLVGTTTDAGAATKLATAFTDGLRELTRNAPPTSKRIVSSIAITAADREVTLKVTVSETDLGLALVEVLNKQRQDEAEERKPIAKLEEFQQKMCSCKDKPCAERVNDEMTKWGTAMVKEVRSKPPKKPNPELARISSEMMTRYVDCMTKLLKP
jgi:hypothetical protein